MLYSNRSAAEASMELWESALQDAEKAIELRPEWSKGYSRRGTALLGLNQVEGAIEALEKGLELEPGNAAMKQSLETAKSRMFGGSSSDQRNPFNDPQLIERLARNPKTAPYLGQPDFAQKLVQIQRDPQALSIHLSDHRIMEALAVMLGVSTAADESSSYQEAEEKRSTKPSASVPAEPALSAEQQEAIQEKELGTAAYKNRDFEAALKHYERAFSLDPTNAALLANKSAVLFEMGSLEECIRVCEEAVSVGREHHAEFKLIGRVLGRIGSCYDRLGDLDQAIKYYNKSLTEARNPEIHEKLKAAERAKVAAEKAKLYDPSLAEQERTAGNEAFKKGDWVTAVKHYTEAIKRDEKDPRAYSNRAACYLKLAAVQEGLRDADKCLELDPAFVKGYLRKAALLFAKREYNQAISVCEAGIEHDSDGKHRQEFQQQIAKCYGQLTGHAGAQQGGAMSDEERAKQAMQNPEIQEILGDPTMRLILKQMESDPKAMMEHMKNPHVAAKIRKLIQCGVIRTG